jgi:hypothetical protein
VKLIAEHGYTDNPLTRLLAFVNPQEAEEISKWKAGETFNGSVANHDYIPSAGAPAYLLPENIVGEIAPATFNGLKVEGSYGPTWIIRSEYVNPGYVLIAATNGPDSDLNVVSVRQHVNPAYQGLRIIPGNTYYPIQESFWARAIGVGARHRGAAVVIQIKQTGTYVPPSIVL